MNPLLTQILLYPFEFFAAMVVALTMIFHRFTAGIWPLMAFYAIALVVSFQGFSSFAGGIITGVLANEITHWFRKK